MPGRLVSASFAVLLLLGCASTSPVKTPAPIQHVVLFTLSDPAMTSRLIDETRGMLAEVPEVRTPSVGTPLDTGRELATHDYHVAVRLGFDDEEDYFAYLSHPAHTAIVARWQPLLTDIRVFDYREERRPRETRP